MRPSIKSILEDLTQLEEFTLEQSTELQRYRKACTPLQVKLTGHHGMYNIDEFFTELEQTLQQTANDTH